MGIQQRTLNVLLVLALGMSALYGVLHVLEPGQRAPLGGDMLMSLDPDAVAGPSDGLFDTPGPLRPWQVIVVHDSGSRADSYETLDRRHTAAGRDGCGYHFVINNGNGAGDGVIQKGYRWRLQRPGDFFEAEAGRDFSRRFETIGICLVGDSDVAPPTAAQQRELELLIGQLRERFGIPADHVFVNTGSPDTAGHFPHEAFRERLARAESAPASR